METDNGGTGGADEVARLEAELAAAREDLHAAWGQMATVVSKLGHDLNNTLGTMRGFADLLVEDTDDQPRLQSSAERIIRAADRTLDVVAEAVASARAIATAHAPDLVNLGELTHEVIAELEAEGATVPSIDTSEAPTVPGMRSKLRRVLRELLVNTATHAPGATGTLGAEGAGDRMTVTFHDDGPGIDVTALDRVLAPGVALQGEGKGDGLATVRRLVEEHAGKVWLTSRPGSGLTVHIALPMHDDLTA